MIRKAVYPIEMLKTTQKRALPSSEYFFAKRRFIAEMRKGVYMLNVLVVCEESQAVCKAFRELGHSAFSLDLQECSGGKLNMDRYCKMQAARDFFMYLYNYDVKYMCIENPIPLSICKLPKASQEINPCWFGADFFKRTYLWLKNLPPLFSTSYCMNPRPFMNAIKSNAKDRSKTFPGIAMAMALQWGCYCNV